MKFEDLVTIVGEEPVFETGLLLAGDVEAGDLRRQLSRWVNAGKIHQLRRGLYSLAPPYGPGGRAAPHPFLVANRLVVGSYVSLQSALSHHGLIPEYVPVTTSVGPGRPQRLDTPLGSFLYRHLQTDLRFGYQQLQLGPRQAAFVATPEKALLDLVHLEPQADSEAYLRELRLQNLETVNLATLEDFARRWQKPKALRAAAVIADLVHEEAEVYQPL